MLLTDAEHMEVHQLSKFVKPEATETNSFVYMVNMALKVAQAIIFVRVCESVCVHTKAAVLWNVN